MGWGCVYLLLRRLMLVLWLVGERGRDILQERRIREAPHVKDSIVAEHIQYAWFLARSF